MKISPKFRSVLVASRHRHYRGSYCTLCRIVAFVVRASWAGNAPKSYKATAPLRLHGCAGWTLSVTLTAFSSPYLYTFTWPGH